MLTALQMIPHLHDQILGQLPFQVILQMGQGLVAIDPAHVRLSRAWI